MGSWSWGGFFFLKSIFVSVEDNLMITNYYIIVTGAQVQQLKVHDSLKIGFFIP